MIATDVFFLQLAILLGTAILGFIGGLFVCVQVFAKLLSATSTSRPASDVRQEGLDGLLVPFSPGAPIVGEPRMPPDDNQRASEPFGGSPGDPPRAARRCAFCDSARSTIRKALFLTPKKPKR